MLSKLYRQRLGEIVFLESVITTTQPQRFEEQVRITTVEAVPYVLTNERRSAIASQVERHYLKLQNV